LLYFCGAENITPVYDFFKPFFIKKRFFFRLANIDDFYAMNLLCSATVSGGGRNAKYWENIKKMQKILKKLYICMATCCKVYYISRT